MKVEITGDKLYAHQLLEWVKFKTITVGKGMRDETKELLRLVVKFTPPQKGKTQGEQAVIRDVQRAIYPLAWRSFTESASMRKIIREKNYPAIQGAVRQFSSNSPAYNTEVVPFSGNIHQRMRDRRGRVNKSRPRFSTPDYTEIKDYIKQRIKAVGQARGGFVAGIEAMGGRAANWITRHKQFGSVTDKSNDVMAPYIEVTNRSRWASYGDEDRIVANAMRTRTSVIRNKIEEALQKASAQAGVA